MDKTEGIKHCTMCGKQFDEWDTQENFGFDKVVTYGSRYDLSTIKMNLCCSCFEKLMDKIIPMCENKPFIVYKYDHVAPDLNKEQEDRVARILAAIGRAKWNRIEEGYMHYQTSKHLPKYVDLLEKELTEEGYDLESVSTRNLTPYPSFSFDEGIKIKRKNSQ